MVDWSYSGSENRVKNIIIISEILKQSGDKWKYHSEKIGNNCKDIDFQKDTHNYMTVFAFKDK